MSNYGRLLYDLDVLQLFQWMHNTNQLLTWKALSHHLELRFYLSGFTNPEAQFVKLKQSTTMLKYMGEFECLSSKIYHLSYESLLNCFLSGLGEDIQ